MATDDGIRAQRGVVACLRSLDHNTVRLVLDDVQADTEMSPKSWTHYCLYTFTDYDANELKEMTLSQKDLAMIGENLVMRLLALNKELK